MLRRLAPAVRARIFVELWTAKEAYLKAEGTGLPGGLDAAAKEIVLLGDRDPRFVTHRELDAAIELFPPGVRGRWMATDAADAAGSLNADALWVVSGGPYRDDDVVYAAIEGARTARQPFLGTCSAFQYAVLEFARHVAGITAAAHAETSPNAAERVIDRLSCSLEEQQREVTAVAGTRLASLCGSQPFVGFHWCNYGLGDGYVDRLVTHGLVVAAHAPDAGVEAVELPDHPFYLATLFQPQIGSLARRLHPIIGAFVAAA